MSDFLSSPLYPIFLKNFLPFRKIIKWGVLKTKIGNRKESFSATRCFFVIVDQSLKITKKTRLLK